MNDHNIFNVSIAEIILSTVEYLRITAILNVISSYGPEKIRQV